MRPSLRWLSASCVALLLLASGCMLPDDSPRVSIEFGAIPELEGAEVLVDGKVVGKLEKTGQATRISFPVEKGEHEVTIHDLRYDCQPAKIRAELPSQKIRLLASIGDTMAATSATGGTKPVITFQY